MSNSKLRVIAHNGPAIAQRKGETASVGCIDNGSSPSAEENVRLLKAFNRVDDSRRRAWLLELVEHFAGLDPAAH
jgi:hypothetical protein